MPGRHCETRLYMRSRQTRRRPKAGISIATAYRIETDPRLRSQRPCPCRRRGPARLPTCGGARPCRCLRLRPACERRRSSRRSAAGIPMWSAGPACRQIETRTYPSTATHKASSVQSGSLVAASKVRCLQRQGEYGTARQGKMDANRKSSFRLGLGVLRVLVASKPGC